MTDKFSIEEIHAAYVKAYAHLGGHNPSPSLLLDQLREPAWKPEVGQVIASKTRKGEFWKVSEPFIYNATFVNWRKLSQAEVGTGYIPADSMSPYVVTTNPLQWAVEFIKEVAEGGRNYRCYAPDAQELLDEHKI